jgi:putative membrane protein
MKFIIWLIRILVFVLLLVLALANTQSVTLNLPAGFSAHAPLILICLGFFAVGLLAGVLATLPALFRARLENGRLRREVKSVRETPLTVDAPPLPPLI